MQAIRGYVTEETFHDKLCAFWSQESNKDGATVELRSQNVYFAKSLGMCAQLLIDWPT